MTTATNEPREIFLIPVWIVRRHLADPRMVLTDSNTVGGGWIYEDELRRVDEQARREAQT